MQRLKMLVCWRRCCQDGDHAYIRLNFNFGPSTEPGGKFPTAIFLKELSYRTGDTRHAAKVRPARAVLRSVCCSRGWDM